MGQRKRLESYDVMSSNNFCTKAKKRKTLIPLFYLCAQSCEVDEVDFDLLKLCPQIVQQNFQPGEVFLAAAQRLRDRIPFVGGTYENNPNPCRLKQNPYVQGADKKIIQV